MPSKLYTNVVSYQLWEYWSFRRIHRHNNALPMLINVRYWNDNGGSRSIGPISGKHLLRRSWRFRDVFFQEWRQVRKVFYVNDVGINRCIWHKGEKLCTKKLPMYRVSRSCVRLVEFTYVTRRSHCSANWKPPQQHTFTHRHIQFFKTRQDFCKSRWKFHKLTFLLN